MIPSMKKCEKKSSCLHLYSVIAGFKRVRTTDATTDDGKIWQDTNKICVEICKVL
jgi:hypothetical protein